MARANHKNPAPACYLPQLIPLLTKAPEIIQAQQMDERQGHKKRPKFSNDLAVQKIQAAKGKSKEQDAINADANHPTG